MENALGMDFSTVRIHQDVTAERIGARAFAQGPDIYFAPGAYRPYDRAGQALLGHELQHVRQQAEGRVRATRQFAGLHLNEDHSLEAEADRLGVFAARGGISHEAVSSRLLPPLQRGSGAGPIQGDFIAAVSMEADKIGSVYNQVGGRVRTTHPHGPSYEAQREIAYRFHVPKLKEKAERTAQKNELKEYVAALLNARNEEVPSLPEGVEQLENHEPERLPMAGASIEGVGLLEILNRLDFSTTAPGVEKVTAANLVSHPSRGSLVQLVLPDGAEEILVEGVAAAQQAVYQEARGSSGIDKGAWPDDFDKFYSYISSEFELDEEWSGEVNGWAGYAQLAKDYSDLAKVANEAFYQKLETASNALGEEIVGRIRTADEVTAKASQKGWSKYVHDQIARVKEKALLRYDDVKFFAEEVEKRRGVPEEKLPAEKVAPTVPAVADKPGWIHWLTGSPAQEWLSVAGEYLPDSVAELVQQAQDSWEKAKAYAEGWR